MAQFELSAHCTMNNHGMHIEKGSKVNINIPLMGILPNNLFGNPRCADMIRQQFSAQGYTIPPNSPILNRGYWDIKMTGR